MDRLLTLQIKEFAVKFFDFLSVTIGHADILPASIPGPTAAQFCTETHHLMHGVNKLQAFTPDF
jgi:hypothetical protein